MNNMDSSSTVGNSRVRLLKRGKRVDVLCVMG